MAEYIQNGTGLVNNITITIVQKETEREPWSQYHWAELEESFRAHMSRAGRCIQVQMHAGEPWPTTMYASEKGAQETVSNLHRTKYRNHLVTFQWWSGDLERKFSACTWNVINKFGWQVLAATAHVPPIDREVWITGVDPMQEGRETTCNGRTYNEALEDHDKTRKCVRVVTYLQKIYASAVYSTKEEADFSAPHLNDSNSQDNFLCVGLERPQLDQTSQTSTGAVFSSQVQPSWAPNRTCNVLSSRRKFLIIL